MPIRKKRFATAITKRFSERLGKAAFQLGFLPEETPCILAKLL